ncbi:hypothetical protein ACFYRI_16065 [Streptomyces microflavus]|uniref:TRADD-N-associated membrane domain-containing protein n=1 Tax=Streptomyces microflavus TaxID=1919 RepID=UPI00367ACBAD
MPTTDADPQPVSDGAPASAVTGWVKRAALFFFFVLTSVASGLIFFLLTGGTDGFISPGVGATGVSGVVAGALVAIFRLARERDAERKAVGESRERLTRAENRLETALRGDVQLHVVAGEGAARSDGSDLETGSQREGEASVRAQRALTLAELWETTHARLGLYHDIATGQAKVSFRNAQVSMGIGFVLLVVFVVLALAASTTAGAIVAGGLGAVAAALAGFVSRTFIRSQESAATHLRSYFDQPLELSRYLAAERLVADGDLTQEQRAELLSALVQAMVAPPVPPMIVTPVPGQPPVA